MSESLGNAYVNIIPKAEGIESELSEMFGGASAKAGEKAGAAAGGGLMSGIGSAIKAGAAALGASIVALGTAVVSGAKEIAEYGDNIDKMSQKMGLSRTAYQEWSAIMQHSGTSIESMQSSMKTLATAVETGNGAFEALGMSFSDVQAMSNEDLFAATITALQNVDDETQRTYLAGQLLGRGATELGALLNTSAEDTEAMRQRVHELGGIMSDDAVLASAAFSDSLQDMTTAMDGIKRGVTAQFLPGLTQMMNGFTSLIAGEEGAEDALAAGFDSILSSVETAGGQFFEIIETIVPQLMDIIIAHLPQIIEGGVTLLIKLGEGIIKAIPTLLGMLPQVFQGIINAFKSVDWMTLGKDIISGLIRGLSGMASELWNAIKRVVGSALDKAKEFLGIGSPSKVFADEVGRWIPAGVALGIDQNAAPLNNAVTTMSGAALTQFDRAVAPGATYAPAGGRSFSLDYDRLSAIMASRPVEIIGDTNKIFRVVQRSNQTRTRQTGYNVLAAAGG